MEEGCTETHDSAKMKLFDCYWAAGYDFVIGTCDHVSDSPSRAESKQYIKAYTPWLK